MHKQIFLIFCLIVGYYLQGQEPYSVSYDYEAGLPSSEIYDVLQDDLGHIWFTSDRGLVKYDGYTFSTITNNDGLANNTNFSMLYYDKKIFINSINGNLTVIENGQIANTKKTDSLLKAKGFVEGFDIVGINRNGELEIFFKQLRRFFKVNYLQHTLVEFNPNFIAIGDSMGIYKTSTGAVLNYLHKNKHDYATVFLKHFSLKNEFIFYTKNDELIVVQNNKLFQKIKLAFKVNRIMQIPNSTDNKKIDFWICSNNGIYIYSLEKNSYKRIANYYSQFMISNAMQDRENNIWITTINHGIKRIPNINNEEIILPGFESQNDKISCLKYKNNVLYVLTYNGKLYASPLGIEKFSMIDLKRKNATYLADYDADYIFCQGYKIKYNGTIYAEKIYEEGFPRFITRLNNGKYLVANYVSYNINSAPNPKSVLHNGYLGKKVLDIIPFQNKWLLATDGGIFYFQENYETTHNVFKIPKVPTDIRVNALFKINEFLCIATMGNGAYITNGKSTVQLSDRTGLASNLVHKIFSTNGNTFYIATNKGLSKASFGNDFSNEKNWEIENFTTAQGLKSNFIADVLEINNTIFVASSSGLHKIATNKLIAGKVPPVISIENIQIKGNSDLLFNEGKNISLSYKENNIKIFFSGICFNKPIDSSFYAYRLIRNGSKAQWGYTNDQSVEFSDLSPGNYIFELKARNQFHVWSDVSKLEFSIRPHFTQRIWFKIILWILIVAALIYLLYSVLKFQRNRHEQKALLQNATIRTREAELNTLRNQMNPHFIYNALNNIQSFIFDNNFEAANNFLGKFSTLMRNSLQYSKTGIITIDNEIKFLTNYLELESMRFPNAFGYEISVDENIYSTSDSIPSMMIQPLLENSVKHAFRGLKIKGALTVNFSTVENNEYILITITDNGPGMPENWETKNVKHKSLGMQIIHERVALLKEQGLEKTAFTFTNLDIGLKIELILPIIYESIE